MSVLSCIPQTLAESPRPPHRKPLGLFAQGVFSALLRGKTLFPPSFRLPTATEGTGNFTRAPSHRQPNPTSLDSPGMRVTAPAWLWLQIFTAAPARAHLPRGPAAWFGRRLAPGSMKARVVRRSAGAGGLQTGCWHLIPPPHPTPRSPTPAQNSSPPIRVPAPGAHRSTRRCRGVPCVVLHHPGNAGGHLLALHLYRDPPQAPKKEGGESFGRVNWASRERKGRAHHPA